MAISYDGKRKDITFCTMLFKLPSQQNLATIKGGNRDFRDFYVSSLIKLIEKFKRVALWCDAEVAQCIRDAGLADKVNMRVMKIDDLPHWGERGDARDIMYEMKKYIGFFLHHKSPEIWVNYLPLTWAKPAIIDWAAANNKFNSDYFMWLDAGAFSPKYENSTMWHGWTGHIAARPKRVKITISVTLGKSRPRFVPNFIYRLYRKFVKIMPATARTLLNQKLVDIAMINADYDVPGGCFMVPVDLAHDFWLAFERARKILKKHRLVCVEQGVFQVMMKLDTDDMFELKYIHGYYGLYAAIADKKSDHLL